MDTASKHETVDRKLGCRSFSLEILSEWILFLHVFKCLIGQFRPLYSWHCNNFSIRSSTVILLLNDSYLLYLYTHIKL